MTDAFMRQGKNYEDAQLEAHEEAFRRYGMSPFSVYHPEAIIKTLYNEKGVKQWNDAWLKFWGIPLDDKWD